MSGEAARPEQPESLAPTRELSKLAKFIVRRQFRLAKICRSCRKSRHGTLAIDLVLAGPILFVFVAIVNQRLGWQVPTRPPVAQYPAPAADSRGHAGEPAPRARSAAGSRETNVRSGFEPDRYRKIGWER